MLPSLFLTVALCGIGNSIAFSSRSDVRIVGHPAGATQTLPAQYVRSFDRWSVIGDDRDELAIERLPTEGDDTFVNPTSTPDLWWPSDIEILQVRPCLDILLQGGVPNYALAGLDVRVPGKSSADGAQWRNYGLNSQPLARQWTTFALAVESGFRVECFVGKAADDAGEREEGRKEMIGGGDAAAGDGGEAEPTTMLWDRFFPGNLGALDERPSAYAMFASERTKEALESVGVFLSGIDASSPVSSGFHVVSFPLTESWTDIPRLEDEEDGYTVVCVATAEPDAESLLDLDEDLVAMAGASILEVDVSQTEPGSESIYLPNSYRPLYTNDN